MSLGDGIIVAMEDETPHGLPPGLVLLQGPRLEDLADMVLGWMALYPPEPLAEDAVVVPSQGVGEWFKAHAARQLGVCAGVSVELPSRWAWRIWRAVLADEDIPEAGTGLFDKSVMTWWLMQHRDQHAGSEHGDARGEVPRCASEVDPSAGRRPLDLNDWRWCRDAADLFDQYQVYRPDWLLDWESGRFVLRGAGSDQPITPMPPEQQWQAEVWQMLVRQARARFEASGAETARRARSRPAECLPRPVIQRRALMRLASWAPSGSSEGAESVAGPRLPGRVVVFAGGPLSPPVFDLLVALSRHRRVVLAVANPCQTHWVDLDEGPGSAEGHPLLGAWGRQVRDVVQQIERIDDRLSALEGRAMVRAEVEADAVTDAVTDDQVDAVNGNGTNVHSAGHMPEQIPEHRAAGDRRPGLDPLRPRASALHGLHSAIGRNESPALTAQRMGEQGIRLTDGSLRFHVAHTPLREVEVLHDHLLTILGAGDAQEALVESPRDIVVMVPDLTRYAPAIRAVFGRHPSGDPRHVPWGLADQHEDALAGWLQLVDWLLGLPMRRATLPELGMLLNHPMVQRRWGLEGDAGADVLRWLEAAGLRWGLNVQHRQLLGWPQGHAAQTWRFAIDRVLAGVAWGTADPLAVAPLPEATGLAARAVGAMASLLQRLEDWLATLQSPTTPAAWCERLRTLASDLWQASDPEDERVLQAFERSLSRWQRESRPAAERLLSWPVMHASMMAILREPPAQARFRAAGVTFCTLMPLRTVPFEAVCLLGMNDGDYPRSVVRSAADLMALPGQSRPGDRSRRDDDRQLMLDAVLSARRHLLISWTGRRPQDNQGQAPSVLVGQLRDYLAAVWGPEAVDAITAEHPLQPFSRRYFEEGPLPGTFAHEWAPAPMTAATPTLAEGSSRGSAESPVTARPVRLAAGASLVEAFEHWLHHPVAALWALCTGVVWRSTPQPPDEDEVLSVDGLQRWRIHDRAIPLAQSADLDVPALLDRLSREGQLPLGAPGRLARAALKNDLDDWAHRLALAGWEPQEPVQPAAVQVPPDWRPFMAGFPEIWPLKGFTLQPVRQGLGLNAVRLLRLSARQLRGTGTRPEWREDALVLPWWTQTLVTACGQPATLILVAPERTLEVPPPDMADARGAIQRAWQAWQDNLEEGLPWPADGSAVRAAFGSTSQQFQTLERLADRDPAWRRQWGRARDWSWSPSVAATGPSVAAWQAATERIYGDFRRWLDRLVTDAGTGAPGEES